MAFKDKATAMIYVKQHGLKGQEKELVLKYFTPASGCFAKNMSDEEYHKKVLAKADSLDTKKKGLNKLGVEEEEVNEIEPVKIVGWEGGIWSPSGEMSSNYGVTWLFFSDKQVYVYQIIFDMLSASFKERAEEYFYKDVTNIATTDDSEQIDLFQKACLGLKLKVVHATVNRSHVKLVVPGDKFEVGLFPKDNEDFEGKIRAVKAKLREKKA